MLKKIYDLSPIFVQNWMVSLKGRQFIKERYTESYFQELKLLKETKNLINLQEKRLNDFLQIAKNKSPYYKYKLKDFKLPCSVKELKEIDFLTKEELRENLEDILTTKEKIIQINTGGTTGKSLSVFTNPVDISRKIAYLDYFKLQHGVKKGMKRVSIGGKEIVPINQRTKIFWRFNKPLNQLLFSAYHADGNNLKYYIDELNRFKPQSIDGFTTVIHRMASYILRNKINITFTPIAIFPTAETLTEEMRNDIERAFNCPVRNQYASSEGAPFITENSKGELEANIQTGVFEFEHLYENVYEMIVTSFYTTTTPLIRYKIGDAVELYAPPGEGQPVKIKSIIGRSNDYLVSEERGIVTNVNLSTVIREAGRNVIESQFIQEELNYIRVLLVIQSFENINQMERKLVSSLESRFGKKTNFIFEYVDEIPQTRGGKTRFIINNLEKYE